MTKDEFLAMLETLYRVANRADARSIEKPADEAWTNSSMSELTCGYFDDIMLNLERSRVITMDEHTAFYSHVATIEQEA